MRFVGMVIDQLTARGYMEPAALYEAPFNSIHAGGLEELFAGKPTIRRSIPYAGGNPAKSEHSMIPPQQQQAGSGPLRCWREGTSGLGTPTLCMHSIGTNSADYLDSPVEPFRHSGGTWIDKDLIRAVRFGESKGSPPGQV